MALSHAGRFTYENERLEAAAAAAAPQPEPGEAPEPEPAEEAPAAKAGPWTAVNPATEKTAASRPARSAT